MEKIKLLLLFVIVIIGFADCGKDNTPKPGPIVQPPPPPPPPPVYNPDSAVQVSPANEQTCTSGVSVSNTESTVTFSWKKADYTDTYELHITNLLTNETIIKSTGNLSLGVTLLKSTPYSWYIISKENNVTYQENSYTWKFYNSGPGVTEYAPYPAELISPAWGDRVPADAASTVTLQWKGTKGSADIKNYDVYYGTSTAPALFQSAVTDTSLTIYAAPNTVYYWKIVTRDIDGSTSTSQVFNFYKE